MMSEKSYQQNNSEKINYGYFFPTVLIQFTYGPNDYIETSLALQLGYMCVNGRKETQKYNFFFLN